MKKKHVIDTVIDSGLITEGACIIAGVSGGPDSLCMLHVLSQLADPYDLTIVPVHVNHKLRAEADDEEDNVSLDMHIAKGKGRDDDMIRIYFYYDAKGLIL